MRIVTKEDGEIPVRDAIGNFLKSPAFQEFSKNCASLWDHAWQHGFWSTFQQLIESLDPLGEKNALKVISRDVRVKIGPKISSKNGQNSRINSPINALFSCSFSQIRNHLISFKIRKKKFFKKFSGLRKKVNSKFIKKIPKFFPKKPQIWFK